MSAAESAERAAREAAVAIVLMNRDGRIVFANPACEVLFSRSARRLHQARLAECGPWGEAASGMAMRALAEAREVIAHDVTIAHGSLRERGSIDVVPDETGACICLRRAPSGAVSARSDGAASAAVGFGRMLSHELKNPIAGARGAAQLIAQSHDGEARELAQLIMTELDRARRIADHWSRVGDILPQPFRAESLTRLAHEAVQSAQAAAHPGVQFVENFDPSLPEAWIDRDLVLQAVLNLLTNAAEAVLDGEGGQVTLSTRYRQPRSGSIVPNARLELEVADNGPGVPEALKDSVFNPFVTGKPAGEGLGLAFVSRVADLHGGGVEFESEPGHTVFRMYLTEEPSG